MEPLKKFLAYFLVLAILITIPASYSSAQPASMPEKQPNENIAYHEPIMPIWEYSKRKAGFSEMSGTQTHWA